MESTNLVERIEKCERILKENAKSQVFAALADALRAKGDIDQAFRVCKQGLRLHPNYGAGHLVMAKINFERKMFDWAEQELNDAVRLDGETRSTEQLRIEILLAKGNVEDSEKAIKRLRSTGASPLMLQDLQQRLEKLKKETKRRQLEQPWSGTPARPRTEREQPQSEEQFFATITLSQALDQLVQLNGVQFIVCAHSNGTVVDFRGMQMNQDVTEVAAFGVEMTRNTECDTALTTMGRPFQIAVETEDRMIVIMKLRKYNLVLFCDKRVNLGSMRLKLDEIVGRLQDA